MKVTQLSGGVGGARLARGFNALDEVEFTVVVNIGDDDILHGQYVSPDLDTVIYTLAGVEGPHGWGRDGDTFAANDELARFGVDNTFRLGDRDLALKLFRTSMLNRGASLSEVTHEITRSFGIGATVLPASDDPVRTQVQVEEYGWISFREYFVARRHQDRVVGLRFEGASESRPSPGTIEAIEGADLVVIGPSNPPLSIWPILSIPGLRDVVSAHQRVVAVSPLIGGKALKGPADRVLESLGLPPGNSGVAEAYSGLLARLIVDTSDQEESARIDGVEVQTEPTLIPDLAASRNLARAILSA